MEHATILVVEDDGHLLSGIRDILELEGYAVVTASDGEKALGKLHGMDQLPDLIVSDIMMPNMDGIELLEQVREVDEFISIPFIYLTARGEKTDIQRGKKLGVDDYVVKPFNADDLLVAIKSRLSRSKAMQRVQAGREDELKRDILTILNHEFRTPLTFVVAYSDMLSDKAGSNGKLDEADDPEMLSFLQGVKSGADRLQRLIENFITLVELETGGARGKLEWRQERITDLGEIVQAGIDAAAAGTRETYTVTLDIPADVPDVTGDVEYIQMAVKHLVDNACKFSDPGQPVTVDVTHTDATVTIAVTDAGRGIPAAEHDKIWEKFYQIDREHYEDQGAGSGLAIVKHVATLHGGDVSVESAPGEGSTFRLHLPLQPQPVPDAQQA